VYRHIGAETRPAMPNRAVTLGSATVDRVPIYLLRHVQPRWAIRMSGPAG
jgi:hypothetical protein